MEKYTETERVVDGMQIQLIAIKDSLNDIEKEMKTELSEFSKQFKDFSVGMSSIMIKLEERDRRFQEVITDNKETFARFGNQIEIIHGRLHNVEMTVQKVAYLEKFTYALATGLGGIFLWLLQKALNL